MSNKVETKGYSRGWGKVSEKKSLPLAFYRRYTAMRGRCHGKKRQDYRYYGGKGVSCLWASFDEFHQDMFSSFNEHVATHGISNTTLDRIDSNGHYCKENCRWATRKEQTINSSRTTLIECDGKTLSLSDWSKQKGVPRTTLTRHIKKYGVTKTLS